MDSATREARTSAAFVSLTNTLVSDFDLVELMHTLIDACIDLLDTDAGGLLLTDANGDLQLMASSVEDVDVVEVVQLAAEAGPCWDCFTTGQAVTLGDIGKGGGPWPEFQRSALERGYRSVHATPMRLQGQTIGTMNLFHSAVGALNERDIALAQALTDVATIAIMQERGTRQLRDLSTHLQGALDSRIVVEQAKGLIAQSLNCDMDQAFTVLRNHARSTNQALRSVARAVAERRLVLTAQHQAAALRGDSARKRPV
ncbi:GAF and ANTAR domain-containing protein [Amnibacterium sp.]|uniref:GAF and ANTAR domain-containing protein n=1 Tax=Amnibacterium sp. TaxID=1872496 RepID=UPI00260D491E|nr:GAF and ANTAR domain-containing protein [Amnibacterium sp.]MCU1474535.1 transcriptional regulator [Amnibacterium sp.]